MLDLLLDIRLHMYAKDLRKKSRKSFPALLSVVSRSSVGGIRQGIRNGNMIKTEKGLHYSWNGILKSVTF